MKRERRRTKRCKRKYQKNNTKGRQREEKVGHNIIEKISRVRRRRGTEMGLWRIVFCNVAGMLNKDKKFWESLRDWNVSSLTETCGKKGQKKVKNTLPRRYIWKFQVAQKRNKKRESTMKRIKIEIKMKLVEERTGIETDKEGIITSKVKAGK